MVAVVTVCSLLVHAQPQELVARFLERSHTHEGFSLPYRLFVPDNYDGSRPHPLIVTFHGAGERGTNNTSQIAVHRIATAWADARVQSLHAPLVVSPQAPPGGRWEDVVISQTGTAVIRSEMATVLDLLDSLTVEFNIDPDRVYATGLSLGGYGTFDAIFRDPGRFAAALAMSGGYSPQMADSIGSLPLFIIHGEADGTVNPLLSKNMVTAFEELGRDVFNWNCSYFGCSPKSDDEIAAALKARRTLIFWGVPNVGHGPWAPWYDDPRVQDWLLGQHRLTTEISVSSPSPGTKTDGGLVFEWSGGEPSDSVEIMFRASPTDDWSLLTKVANSGSLALDVSTLPETPLAQFEIVVVDPENFAYGRGGTSLVTIDRPGDTPPFAQIVDYGFRRTTSVVEESGLLNFKVADVETSTLSIEIGYRPDPSADYETFDVFPVESSGDQQSRIVDFKALPNGDLASFRLRVSDGNGVSEAFSPSFRKASQRMTTAFVEHEEGEGSARIRINFVDPNALTGHRYRLTFQVPDQGVKTYSVEDLDTAVDVVVEFPVDDYEGPVFDGMRLEIADVKKAEADRNQTGWKVGDANLAVSVRAPRVTLAGESIESLATPADYRFEFFDTTVDTTSDEFEFEAVPIRFTVRNLTSGGRRDVLFDDVNKDGIPSPSERLYILEENEGRLLPAWFLSFVRVAPERPPESGDVWELITIKPATEADVYEFIGMIGVRNEADEELPPAFSLGQNYPNPFAGSTAIPFRIDSPARISIMVHDVLGRIVATVFEGRQQPGEHTVRFESSLSSGIYFCRLTISDGSGRQRSVTNRMMVVK